MNVQEWCFALENRVASANFVEYVTEDTSYSLPPRVTVEDLASETIVHFHFKTASSYLHRRLYLPVIKFRIFRLHPSLQNGSLLFSKAITIPAQARE
jgi:hypothetical protein